MHYVKTLVLIVTVMVQSNARGEEIPDVGAMLAANRLMMEKV